MATLLISVIYLCFISLGLPDSLLGSAWPVMQGDLGVPVSFMGIVTMVISGCTIVSSLFTDRIARRMGTWGVTLLSTLLTAVGLIGFSFSNHFAWLCVFALPYGLGAGAIDAVLNNYIALHYSSRYMSWLHCFWGVGAIASPYIMGFALSNAYGWDSGYRIVAYAQLGIAFITALSLPLWRRKKAASAEDETTLPTLSMKQKLSIPGVPFILLAFLCYCGLEATAMSWSSTYFVDAKGMDTALAASLASMFYIGMTVGRFISGFITDFLGDKRLMRIGACIALVGIVILALPFGQGVAIVAFLVIGLGCAPIYPAIIHATPDNFGREKSQAVIGLQMASAYVGATFIPPLYGLIVNHIHAVWLPLFLVIFLVFFILFSELLNHMVRKNKKMC